MSAIYMRSMGVYKDMYHTPHCKRLISNLVGGQVVVLVGEWFENLGSLFERECYLGGSPTSLRSEIKRKRVYIYMYIYTQYLVLYKQENMFVYFILYVRPVGFGFLAIFFVMPGVAMATNSLEVEMLGVFGLLRGNCYVFFVGVEMGTVR